MSSPSRLLALCGALITLAVAAPAASADSIAYIKDGDVWLSTGDGSRQYRVTTTGRYADVSQADDGTMIALTRARARPASRRPASSASTRAERATRGPIARPAGTRSAATPAGATPRGSTRTP